MNITGLHETRTWSGQWWLPGRADERVPGVLTYEPRIGLRLQLIGGFEDRVFGRSGPNFVDITDEVREFPVVHGPAENLQLTLLDCLPISTRRGWIGAPVKQEVSALTAVVGAHIDTPEQALFTEAQVSIENLKQWSDSSGFSKTRGVDQEKRTAKASISVAPVEPLSAGLGDATLSLNHIHTLPYFENLRGMAVGRMTDTAVLNFRTELPWSLATAQAHVKTAQDLLSLASHRACGILWLKMRIHQTSDAPTPDEDQPRPQPWLELYARHTVAAAPEEIAVAHHDMLFTCRDVPFVQVVPRWFELRRRCEAAVNLVLGLRYIPEGYIETRLLAAVGAAEALHRALGIEQPRLPPEEFEALYACLREHVPKERRGWLKEKVGRNEPTLRTRLEELARRPNHEAMGQLVPDVEQWAKTATQARNALAHEGHTPSQSIDQVVAAVKVTTTVVVMNLLHELGVPTDHQQAIANDHAELRQVAKSARKHLMGGGD